MSLYRDTVHQNPEAVSHLSETEERQSENDKDTQSESGEEMTVCEDITVCEGKGYDCDSTAMYSTTMTDTETSVHVYSYTHYTMLYIDMTSYLKVATYT